MKLYKFRSLGNETDYERVKDIIETGKFWCSKLWDLNDPREGVYTYSDVLPQVIRKIFDQKNGYLICSFSAGEQALNNPLLWGYYANGFKGVAIEIEVDEDKIDNGEANKRTAYKRPIKKIKYLTKQKFETNFKPICEEIANPRTIDTDIQDAVEKIITRKLDNWKHENEYRFLTKSYENEQEIGKITNVYFGNPWGLISNHKDVKNNSENLQDYFTFTKDLEQVCKKKGIDPQYYPKSENGETKP